MEYRLALIGFGVVGQGLVEILVNEKDSIKVLCDADLKVTAVSDIQKGSVYDPRGLDLNKILDLVKATGSIHDYPGGIKGWDSLKTIRNSNANVVIEVSVTNITTGEPALTHLRTAIEHRKHVVTTNKGPLSLACQELLNLAAKAGVELRFEGTVLSGTPAITLAMRDLAWAHITGLRGIVNGTCNYILTEMDKGLSYDTALSQARRLGYAEADPTADVEGLDSLAKILILANALLGGHLTRDQVLCEGISKITQQDVAEARAEGRRWKLIAAAKRRDDGSLEAYVRPEKIPLDDPLAVVAGVTNALTYETKYLDRVTIMGPGAGKVATGYAVLHDILDIHRTLSGQRLGSR